MHIRIFLLKYAFIPQIKGIPSAYKCDVAHLAMLTSGFQH